MIIENDLLFFILFFLLWLTFIGVIIYVVRSKGNCVFNLDFKEIHERMPESYESFSVRLLSFDFPKAIGFALPPAMRINGFYARLFVYEDALLIKFFNRAMLITSSNEITVINKFWGLISVKAGMHSLQFRIPAGHYNIIEKWINTHKIIL